MNVLQVMLVYQDLSHAILVLHLLMAATHAQIKHIVIAVILAIILILIMHLQDYVQHALIIAQTVHKMEVLTNAILVLQLDISMMVNAFA